MQRYEYKAVPAPARAEKVKGLKLGKERFAHSLSAAINAMAEEGWEYIRADTLPCEERKGLMGSTTTHYHTLLIFRRQLRGVESQPAALIADQRATREPVATPAAVAPMSVPVVAPEAPASEAPASEPPASEPPESEIPAPAAPQRADAAVLRAEKTPAPAAGRRLSLVAGDEDTAARTPRIGPAEDAQD